MKKAPSNPIQNTTLILITNHFPYGFSESFLESEMEWLVKSFHKVIVVARDVHSPQTRPLQAGYVTYRINPESSLKEKILTCWLYVRHFKKALTFVAQEIQWLKQHNKKMTLVIWRDLIHTLTKALTTSHHLHAIIRQQQLTGNVTLYSYWLTSSALATAFITRKGLSFRRLARAHGGDVYEYRNAQQYLSFRSTLAKTLDGIYVISENGARHLKQQVSAAWHGKIHTSRLGSRFAGQAPPKMLRTPFVVLSCSFVLPVKRIHLIIEALEQIHDVDIQWIHIGDGPLSESLQAQARETLAHKPNIKHTFLGARTHAEVLEFYTQHAVDLFINTSASEGIPVTIMEAQSFGIPVVAPSVGGIPEIVSETCGHLFPVDASAQTIADSIRSVATMPDEAYRTLRAAAFQNWKERYNSDRNFSTFVADILSL